MKFIVSSFLLVILILNTSPNPFITHHETGIFRYIDEDYFESLQIDRALERFASSLTVNAFDQTLRGVYVAGILHSPVTPQPPGNPAFVSTQVDVITEFSTARQYGSIGLLAHNTQAGKQFDKVLAGDTIVLVFGDGSTVNYTVTEIRKYQALDPSSPYSSFVNVNIPGEVLSVDEMFLDTYGVSGRLILQTCISEEKNDSWGRLFIIAIKD